MFTGSRIVTLDAFLQHSDGIWLNPSFSIAKLHFFWECLCQKPIWTTLEEHYQIQTLPQNQPWKYLQLRLAPTLELHLVMVIKTFGIGRETSD